MDSLSGYLDNMSATAMNDSSVLEQYTENFTNISNNNTTLANTVKKKEKELTDLCRKNNSLKKKLSAAAEPGEGSNEQNNVGIIIPDFLGCGPSYRWVKGAYFWSH